MRTKKIIKLSRLCRIPAIVILPAIVISIPDFCLFMEELALTVMP
jgi:hypothetical protein